MRFTFVILLFLSLGADAQMIIKAHPNYVPLGINTTLDIYTGAAAAYSLRKLRTAYTGNAIRVRRSNDNTEQDIGFTSAGDLDTTSLKTFVGANSGFVTTWYDQSGNARNPTNSTASQQPRIVLNGVIDRSNNKPSIRWINGSSQNLTLANAQLGISQPVTFFAISQLTAASGINASALFDSRQTENRMIFYTTGNYESPNNTFRFGTSTLVNLSTATVNQNLYSCLFNTTSSQVWRNNISIGTGSIGSGTLLGLIIGNIRAGFGLENVFDWSGWISELIIYPSNQSSNRTGIENNINSYYGIY
jgi:hypothetical protein